MNPFIEFNGVIFLNVPAAQSVIDEVLVEDCYQIKRIPDDSIVLDIGSLYGEFGIYMALAKGCYVAFYEPNPESALILESNLNLNRNGGLEYVLHNAAVGKSNKMVQFEPNKSHPGGSCVSKNGNVSVACLGIKAQIDKLKNPFRDICVKIDCEGSESDIFEDTSWLEHVDIVTMEWHNYDGHVYAEVLRNHGFSVEVTGGGPPPRSDWNPTICGGLIFAHR